MSIYLGLTSNHVLGRIISISGWVPLYDHLYDQLFGKEDDNTIKGTDFELLHGKDDKKIPVNKLYESAQKLRELKPKSKVNVRTFKGVGHQINRDMINSIKFKIKTYLKRWKMEEKLLQ